MMTWRRLVAPVLVCLVVSACGGTGSPPGNTPATSAPLTAGAGAVRDCGTFMLDQGEEIDPAAYRCLVEAATAKQPARLVITQPTTEGDPIPVTYVVDASGSVEVSTDSSQDRFAGDPGIQTQTCTGPSVQGDALRFAHCT